MPLRVSLKKKPVAEGGASVVPPREDPPAPAEDGASTSGGSSEMAAAARGGGGRGRVVRGAKMRVTTLDQLYTKLETHHKGCRDIVVKGSDITFHESGLLEVKQEPGNLWSWGDIGFSQFCGKLKLPVDFIRKSPQGDGPASQKALVDFWLREQTGKSFFLRLRELPEPDPETGARGLIRASLTERYNILDYNGLLDMLEPLVTEHEMTLQVGPITDKNMHLRLIFPDELNIPHGDLAKDGHNVGIHVRDSEVGATTLRGDLMLYRQVCTNGAIALVDGESLFAASHKGKAIHELRASVLESASRVASMKEAITVRVEETTTMRVKRPLAEIGSIVKAAGGTADMIDAAKNAFDLEPQATRFGVVQAITRAAQRFPMEYRVKLEEAAGRILLAA